MENRHSVMISVVLWILLLFAGRAMCQGPGHGGWNPVEMLRGMDRNHNGMLEPDEMSDRAKYFVRRIAERAHLDPNRPMPIDKLVHGVEDWRRDEERRREEERHGDSHHGGTSSAAGSGNSWSNILGFGNDTGLPNVPGFGVTAEDLRESTVPLEKRYEGWVIERVNGTFKRYDTNHNGILDQKEWAAVEWRGDPRESDLNHDGRLTKAEFCERYVKRYGKGRIAPPNSPAVASNTGDRESSSDRSKNSSDIERYKQYAKKLFERYDANHSRVLEKDEWSRMSNSYHTADANRDGRITFDELVRAVASQNQRHSAWGRRRESDARGGGSSADALQTSYRRRTPAERLPEGLPDWFVLFDADGDGQVAMAEFSTTWSESKIAEFTGYDLNDDGFITPKECLAAEKKAEEAKEAEEHPEASPEARPDKEVRSRHFFGGRG